MSDTVLSFDVVCIATSHNYVSKQVQGKIHKKIVTTESVLVPKRKVYRANSIILYIGSGY